ncbi:hypothetical protein EJ05DRAFT_25750 [Pseudovirgaria hyperparasitica]|uniref:Uncharacterized protein n=1 Tax=Pseudovirgaria hyperparasitica TaxID=470096 RepID=A0A6A6WLP8_9PEZI|nr:uncharacterized protein EJ05DRAFT_25750 [Pseudovirgaria hyperparasitica]KAF2763093.1 hypothetical protein EJ05DRAFT_25750 [Pseudovirgaria hyperparasitica]
MSSDAQCFFFLSDRIRNRNPGRHSGAMHQESRTTLKRREGKVCMGEEVIMAQLSSASTTKRRNGCWNGVCMRRRNSAKGKTKNVDMKTENGGALIYTQICQVCFEEKRRCVCVCMCARVRWLEYPGGRLDAKKTCLCGALLTWSMCVPTTS